MKPVALDGFCCNKRFAGIEIGKRLLSETFGPVSIIC